MAADTTVLDTLFLPFTEGQVEWRANSLFLYADWHPALGQCDVLHIDKPAVDRLAAHGYTNLPYLDRRYDAVLIQIPKQVQEAQGLLALAIDHLEKDGLLIVAADNDANGKRLQKWMQEAGFTEITSESKNRARVAWGRKSDSVMAPDDWAVNFAVRPLNGYFTRPGLFSWDSIDHASQLLADNLPALSGDIADFGCGWGFLSCEALKKGTNIHSLTLIDADSRAVTCATANTEEIHPSASVVPLWHDLTRPLPESVPALDTIIMNPPFHIGKKTDLDLGLSFIRTAFAQLKKGGALFMVANAHLRYEEELGKLFKTVELVIQKNGFKVIKAVK